MRAETILKNAYAIPLTNPVHASCPVHFVNREIVVEGTASAKPATV
jgi:acetoacetate decarboxylase